MHAGLNCLRTLNEPLQYIQQHSPVVLKPPKAMKKYKLKKKKKNFNWVTYEAFLLLNKVLNFQGCFSCHTAGVILVIEKKE